MIIINELSYYRMGTQCRSTPSSFGTLHVHAKCKIIRGESIILITFRYACTIK